MRETWGREGTEYGSTKECALHCVPENSTAELDLKERVVDQQEVGETLEH